MPEDAVPSTVQDQPKRTWSRQPKTSGDMLDDVDQELAAQVRISRVMRGLRLDAPKKVIAWFHERYPLTPPSP